MRFDSKATASSYRCMIKDDKEQGKLSSLKGQLEVTCGESTPGLCWTRDAPMYHQIREACANIDTLFHAHSELVTIGRIFQFRVHKRGELAVSKQSSVIVCSNRKAQPLV